MPEVEHPQVAIEKGDNELPEELKDLVTPEDEEIVPDNVDEDTDPEPQP